MRSDDARRRRPDRPFVHIQNVVAVANMLSAGRSSAVSTQFGPWVFRRGGRHIAAVAQRRTCWTGTTIDDRRRGVGQQRHHSPPYRTRLAANRRLRAADPLPYRHVLCAVAVGGEKSAPPVVAADSDRPELAVAAAPSVRHFGGGDAVHERPPGVAPALVVARLLLSAAASVRHRRSHAAADVFPGDQQFAYHGDFRRVIGYASPAEVRR